MSEQTRYALFNQIADMLSLMEIIRLIIDLELYLEREHDIEREIL
tara:strand:+ start:284 stop:418 length:135 start_codon:yes stop_codon:yes gene_type:complete